MSAFALAWFCLVVAWMPSNSMGAEKIGIDSAALVQAVKSHIVSRSSYLESEVEIRAIGNVNGTELPPGDITFRIVQKTPPSTYRGLLLSVEALADAAPARTFWISVDVVIHTVAVQAARRLPFGTILSADDIKEEPIELKDARAELIRNTRDAIGKITRRTLSPGDPLTRETISDPYLVKNGETIRLKLDRGLISLAMQARAEQNGRLGDLIRVRNVDFPKSVLAHVTGPGEARIE